MVRDFIEGIIDIFNNENMHKYNIDGLKIFW